jgi:hypothetical protein
MIPAIAAAHAKRPVSVMKYPISHNAGLAIINVKPIVRRKTPARRIFLHVFRRGSANSKKAIAPIPRGTKSSPTTSIESGNKRIGNGEGLTSQAKNPATNKQLTPINNMNNSSVSCFFTSFQLAL